MGKFIRPEGTNRPKSQIRDHLSRPSALVGLARHGGEPGQAHVASTAHRSHVGTRWRPFSIGCATARLAPCSRCRRLRSARNGTRP
ncbi:hypothetical protein C4K22_4101 [Pseudomonas chlororaphis subsp. aurantiaca]|nr:hypothetical protein C4K24_3945 [Pseudomonas chlororaphis subsp. aurantiaca]AZD36840.1 hypothetical protein C4K22_4101 [Pseudomonas chlororaphis subsp. aurantiaca]AZD43180.1 hypothetical protein C4K21_4110 [Pseudomonas chlororaphis subsp. aurantiaca]